MTGQTWERVPIDAQSVDLSNPREAGMAVYVAITNSFKGDQLLLEDNNAG